MGLAERRAIDTYKKGPFEAKCKELAEICGYPLQIDVKWDTIESDPQCVWFFERDKLESFFFERMRTALKSICQDEMGKEALKAKVDKIVFNNISDEPKWDGRSIVVSNRLDGSGSYDAQQIQEVIEKSL